MKKLIVRELKKEDCFNTIGEYLKENNPQQWLDCMQKFSKHKVTLATGNGGKK
jgi:hypothetical protein